MILIFESASLSLPPFFSELKTRKTFLLSYACFLWTIFSKSKVTTLPVIDECPKMLGSCSLFIVSSSSMMLEKPLYLYTGEHFCRVVTSFFVLGTEHWFPGGLGIALFRWLLIKCSTKLHIDKFTAVLFSSTTLAFSSMISYLSFKTPNANFNPTNICLDRSEDFRTTYSSPWI